VVIVDLLTGVQGLLLQESSQPGLEADFDFDRTGRRLVPGIEARRVRGSRRWRCDALTSQMIAPFALNRKPAVLKQFDIAEEIAFGYAKVIGQFLSRLTGLFLNDAEQAQQTLKSVIGFFFQGCTLQVFLRA